MLKFPTWLTGTLQRVAVSILVAMFIFLLAAAIPAFVIRVFDDYVLGQNGSPNLKIFLALSEHLILVAGTGLSLAFLMFRLSGEQVTDQK